MQFQQIRGATSKITFGGNKFLLDPFLGPKLRKTRLLGKYRMTSLPMVDLPLPMEEIIDVDAVIVTQKHHFDHFDRTAERVLPKDIPMFVASEQEVADMRVRGFTSVTALNNEGVSFGPVTLYRVDARQADGITAEYFHDALGLPAGACGVIFRAEGEKVLYVGGDSVWYDGVRQTIEDFRPGIIAINAMLRQQMQLDWVREVAGTAPGAALIATRLGTDQKGEKGHAEMLALAAAEGLDYLHIPDNGESLRF